MPKETYCLQVVIEGLYSALTKGRGKMQTYEPFFLKRYWFKMNSQCLLNWNYHMYFTDLGITSQIWELPYLPLGLSVTLHCRSYWTLHRGLKLPYVLIYNHRDFLLVSFILSVFKTSLVSTVVVRVNNQPTVSIRKSMSSSHTPMSRNHGSTPSFLFLDYLFMLIFFFFLCFFLLKIVGI